MGRMEEAEGLYSTRSQLIITNPTPRNSSSGKKTEIIKPLLSPKGLVNPATQS